MSNIKLGYNITTDPNFLIDRNHITPELSSKLERLYHLALDGKKSNIQKILNAIDQYPNNPQLKNYLSVLYGKLNETQKVYDVNKWIIAEHPNYLFGKLNLANEYYLKQEYDKIPVVLGQEMEIKALYPDRQTFHLDEVISFLYCAVLYFTAIDNLEQAEVRYELMHQLAPNAKDTELALHKIFAARMKAGQKRFEEEQKSKIVVTTKNQQVTTMSRAPTFNHQEIEWLYCNGLYIEKEKLNTILSLPKVTLVQDLELVLKDSISRYGYFQKLIDEDGWDEEKMNFVIHSLNLLGELKASESIYTIFNIFSQSEAYIELYLGDFITTILWEPLFKIASNNLEECKQFIFSPGNDTYARTILLDMVEQIALHHPERRQEVINWFADIIEFFLSSSIEDNVIDSDLIGLLICNVIDIKGIELLPQIEKLFDREIVSKSICGDWKAVSAAFQRPDKYDNKKEILSIVDRYKEVTSTWAGYNEEDNMKFDYSDYSVSSEHQVRSESKIGRNEPCPCGSGKKYKKCCLNI